MFEYKAEVVNVVNVVDGDTYDLAIDLGFNIHYKVRARLNGVDTPEKNTPFGKFVKLQVALLLLGKKFKVITTKPDKYGRTLITLETADGRDLTNLLIGKGMAKPYDGGTKIIWTPEELSQTSLKKE